MCEHQPPARGSFSSDTHAAEHVCDHVLTRPEAHDMALVIPDYRSFADPTNDEVLLPIAASFFSDEPRPEALALCQGYVRAIRQAIDDALRCGFWWQQREGGDRFHVGVGLNGLRVIWDRQVIRTSYVPRNSRLSPGGPGVPRIENPLPRRDRNQRLPPLPPDTVRALYELFRETFDRVCKEYENAYYKREILWAGSNAFVQRAPRIGKWQELIAGRPCPETVAVREEHATPGRDSS